MSAYHECCRCRAICQIWERDGEAFLCLRCWARAAARDVMAATPHVWDTYAELTRSESDGDGLDEFRLEVLDVVRATMPRHVDASVKWVDRVER